MKIVDDQNQELPWDGKRFGRLKVAGFAVAQSYFKGVGGEILDENGFFDTGDVATIDPNGYMQITDRAKDVIKSGGEWISSVELEGLLMAHPEVVEASVVGVPDEKWGERPLACVVRKEGSDVDAVVLCEFLGQNVARWQLPERWTFISEVPKTSVGKFDKKVLRAQHAAGDLEVQTL
jgi:fatty-acyl-CoA synthase